MDNAILGVLIGGGLTLLGVFITNAFNRSNLKLQLKQQESREDRKLQLEKIEEIHILLGQLSVKCNDFVVAIYELSQKKSSSEEYYVAQNALLDGHSKIVSMVRLYIPEITDEFVKVMTRVDLLLAMGVDTYKGIFPIQPLESEMKSVRKDFLILLEKIEMKSFELTGANNSQALRFKAR